MTLDQLNKRIASLQARYPLATISVRMTPNGMRRLRRSLGITDTRLPREMIIPDGRRVRLNKTLMGYTCEFHLHMVLYSL